MYISEYLKIRTEYIRKEAEKTKVKKIKQHLIQKECT